MACSGDSFTLLFYHVRTLNKFVSLEDVYAEVDINSAWEMIRRNITISGRESL
jgi:hypothetical protein